MGPRVPTLIRRTSPAAEASDLKSLKAEFESQVRYQLLLNMTTKFTKEETQALKDCLEYELKKFTKDPALMPKRIQLLTNVLTKLD